MTLDLLEVGKHAKILQVRSNASSKRLRELGFVRNAILFKEKCAPLGDPMEILIHNYHIALRQEEAQNIEIEEI